MFVLSYSHCTSNLCHYIGILNEIIADSHRPTTPAGETPSPGEVLLLDVDIPCTHRDSVELQDISILSDDNSTDGEDADGHGTFTFLSYHFVCV